MNTDPRTIYTNGSLDTPYLLKTSKELGTTTVHNDLIAFLSSLADEIGAVSSSIEHDRHTQAKLDRIALNLITNITTTD